MSFWVILFAAITSADGYWLDPNPPEIVLMHIRSEIQFRFATTLVTSVVRNHANHTQDSTFQVTLPEEAFISNFTLEIDGVVYPGLVKDKDEARRDYERAKKKGQSTGLLSQKPRDTKNFKVEISIAKESTVTFNLTYIELLKRTRGFYEHRMFIKPGQPVGNFQIDVAIVESRDITYLHVPPLKEFAELLTNEIAEDVPLSEPNAEIVRPDDRSAFITFVPEADQWEEGLLGKFVVQYDVERGMDGGDVLVVNGYFVHFLAPDLGDPLPTDVLFIVDVSGSMSGKKIKQCRESLLSMLDQLRKGDRFNIIKFNDNINTYNKDMVDVDDDSVQSAKTWVKKNINALGGTNINSAVLKGIDTLLTHARNESRAPLILFMTDGEPTSGVANGDKILTNIQDANEGSVPIFTLGYGRGADFGLLKKMAGQNQGVARKIYEDSDAALQIAGFYDEVSATLLNDVEIKYLGDGVDDESLTRNGFRNYFLGSEIVVAGKLEDGAPPTLNLEITGDGPTGNIILVDSGLTVNSLPKNDLISVSDLEGMTEKLWAYLSIKQLLLQVDSANSSMALDLKDKAKQLALKYGFVTSLTSMVVVKPDVIDDRPTTTPEPTTTTTRRYRKYSGGGGGGGGGYGGGGGGDPHFMIRVPEVDHPLCFDIHGNNGDIQNLVTDPRHGITIKSQLKETTYKNIHGENKIFIGQISVQTKHHVIVFTPEAIFFDDKVYTWDEERTRQFGGHELVMVKFGREYSIRFRFGAEFLIKRHTGIAGVAFLNVYVKNEEGFSPQTTGLIGQFVNGQKRIIYKKDSYQLVSGKHMGKFQVREGPRFLATQLSAPVTGKLRLIVKANLIERSEVVSEGSEQCWMVHREFESALIGDIHTYLSQELISE
ncbi:inter-alpha-trypsin inhibitor heavy chain H3-like [Mya arenaria]|uniref:inter-alpha-trypsin inhibitor heavy chain H3-like n=1 Tax=Mya arenaria TaxID=6604 RepID=UPI0022E28409|nr:inter-alpha-trypsin inhibitor heavy chain H3-like [Mya arenaria]